MNKVQRYCIGFVAVRAVTGLQNHWMLTKDYHKSRLNLYENESDLRELQLVTTLTTLFQSIGLVCAYKAYEHLRVRTLAMISILGTIIGYFHSHFVTDVYVFLFIYPATVGFFNGIIAITIVFPLLKNYNNYIGRALAVSRAAFVFGVFQVYGLLEIINPDDDNEIIKAKGESEKWYPPSLMGRFSSVMCYNLVTTFLIGVGGVMIMNTRLKDQEKKLHSKLLQEPSNSKGPDTTSLKSENPGYIYEIMALTVMNFVMIFNYTYYENKYNDSEDYKYYSALTFTIDIIGLLIIGWLFDRYREYTSIICYTFLILFGVHSLAYTMVKEKFKLYMPFSILTNSIELVIAMKLIRASELEKVKPKVALKAFSIISVGAAVACLLNFYYESRLSVIPRNTKVKVKKFESIDYEELGISCIAVVLSLSLFGLAEFKSRKRNQKQEV